MATNKWSVSLFYWATRFGQKANTSQPVEQKGTVSINKARQCNQFKVTLGLICLQKCTRCHVWGCTHTHTRRINVPNLSSGQGCADAERSGRIVSWQGELNSSILGNRSADCVPGDISYPQSCCPIWIQKLISCKLYGGFPPRISEKKKNKPQSVYTCWWQGNKLPTTAPWASIHFPMKWHPSKLMGCNH